MRRSLLFVLLIVSGLLALSTCGPKEEEAKPESTVTSEVVKQETKEALETASAYTQEQMREYQEKVKARLAQLDKKLAELQAGAEMIKAEPKTELNQTVEELKKKQEAVRGKLEELQSASGKAWEDAKSGVDQAMEDLEKAYEQAASRFGSVG